MTVGCDYRKKIADAGLSINRNGDLRSQKIIFNTLVEQLDMISQLSSGNYVTDRSPIDAYVYTTYLFKHRPELKIAQADLDTMFNDMTSAVRAYDRIVFLDLDNCSDVEIVDDKFRDTDVSYRIEIDQLFKEAFKKLGKDFICEKLNTKIKGSREERLEMFIKTEGKNFCVPIEKL